MGIRLTNSEAARLGIKPRKREKRTNAAPKPLPSILFQVYGLPEPVPEYRFHLTREWRFDYAWPEPSLKIALEVEGGIWTRGRHVRGKGYLEDCRKYNAAALLGWRVFRCTPKTMQEVLLTVKEAMGR